MLFVDDVPVLWCTPAPEPDLLDRLRSLGDRAKVGEWSGEYPLTGDVLDRSLRLLHEVVDPLCRDLPWWRSDEVVLGVVAPPADE